MVSMKKRFIVLTVVLLACSIPSWATWTLVQSKQSASCTSSSNTCSFSTIVSMSAGNIILIGMAIANTSDTISSVSGDGTYTHCSNCHGSDSGATSGVDMAYNLNTTGGSNVVITVTRSSSTTAGWTISEYEFSFTGTGVALDSSGSTDKSTSAHPLVGQSLTLTGTNDAIMQVGRFSRSESAVTSGGSCSYTSPSPNNNSAVGMAGAINCVDSGSPPSWTFSANTTGAVAAIAISETQTASSCNNYIALMGAGCE